MIIVVERDNQAIFQFYTQQTKCKSKMLCYFYLDKQRHNV